MIGPRRTAALLTAFCVLAAGTLRAQTSADAGFQQAQGDAGALLAAGREKIARRPAGVGTVPLEDHVLDGFDMIVDGNLSGLGIEAAQVRDWGRGRSGLVLALSPSGFALTDGKSESRPLSAGLGRAISGLNSYFGLYRETTARPISFDELKAAVLSEQGLADIRGLFEAMLAQPVVKGDILVFPEIGGEATLTDGRVVFHRTPEAGGRAILRQISAARSDRLKMIELYEANREIMKQVDEYGTLWKALMDYPEWVKKGHLPKERLDQILAETADLTVGSAVNSFDWGPKEQFNSLIQDSWSGRYAGPWHTHPPLMTRQGWRPPVGGGPSGNDMDIAQRHGQNLTVEFEPDGFDVFDLSPLTGAAAIDPAAIRVISYRSPEWKEHFQQLWRELPAPPRH